MITDMTAAAVPEPQSSKVGNTGPTSFLQRYIFVWPVQAVDVLYFPVPSQFSYYLLAVALP